MASPIINLIEENVKTSMKERNKERTLTLRLAISEFKKEEIDKRIVIADLEIGYDQFVYTYRSEVKLHIDKSEINVRNLDGPFKYLENNWNFIDIGKNKCEIHFNIDFELNISLLDILMKKFFDLAFQKMVEAFINRAEEIY